MKKMPKVIYMRIVNNGTEDEYFEADDDVERMAEIGEARTVGVYELKHIKKVTAEIEIR